MTQGARAAAEPRSRGILHKPAECPTLPNAECVQRGERAGEPCNVLVSPSLRPGKLLPRMTPQELLPLLQRALVDHESGRMDEAEAAYRRVLAEHPDNADALHLMGVLLTQRGRASE